MSNIKQVKLIDGTDLLGDVTEHGDASISVRNPMYLCPESGGVILIDYLPLSEDSECTFKPAHVLTVSRVQKDMISYYNNSVMLAFEGTKQVIDSVREANETIRQRMIVDEMESTEVH